MGRGRGLVVLWWNRGEIMLTSCMDLQGSFWGWLWDVQVRFPS